MRNKMKAWRLGAAVLNAIQFVDSEGRERSFPAARVVKDTASLLGSKLRQGVASSRFVGSDRPQRFKPSGYVAPRRRSLRQTGEGQGFVLIGQPQQEVA